MRWRRQQPVRPIGRFTGRRGRRAGGPAAGHGQDQAADVPRPLLRARALSGPHVQEVRSAWPVRRFVAGHGGRCGRELGVVRVLRPVPARGGRGHRGPGRQADGRAQQRGGRMRGVRVLVRGPVPCRTGQDQAASGSRAGRIPRAAVPRFRLPRHQGHCEAPWPRRSVPRTGDDSGPGDAQLLLLLRSVRGGPGGAETGRSNPCRLRPAGHHSGRSRGRCASVDGHVPGGRGQVSDTAGRRDAHARLDHVHVAHVPERGRGRTVQRPCADARQVRSVVRRAVPRLRVHQKAVRHLGQECWSAMGERPGTHLSLGMWVIELVGLSNIPANFEKFKKFKVRLKLTLEIECYLNSNVSNSSRKFKFHIDTIIKCIIIPTYQFFTH